MTPDPVLNINRVFGISSRAPSGGQASLLKAGPDYWLEDPYGFERHLLLHVLVARTKSVCNLQVET